MSNLEPKIAPATASVLIWDALGKVESRLPELCAPVFRDARSLRVHWSSNGAIRLWKDICVQMRELYSQTDPSGVIRARSLAVASSSVHLPGKIRYPAEVLKRFAEYWWEDGLPADVLDPITALFDSAAWMPYIQSPRELSVISTCDCVELWTELDCRCDLDRRSNRQRMIAVAWKALADSERALDGRWKDAVKLGQSLRTRWTHAVADEVRRMIGSRSEHYGNLRGSNLYDMLSCACMAPGSIDDPREALVEFMRSWQRAGLSDRIACDALLSEYWEEFALAPDYAALLTNRRKVW